MEVSEIRAQVHAVAADPRHGFSKQPQLSICLLENVGVDGDSHCGTTVQHLYLKRRNPSAPNRMQVHLLPLETLFNFANDGYVITPGQFGENITTTGIDLHILPLGTLLSLGNTATVELTGLRTPCAKIDRFRPGLLRHCWQRDSKGNRIARAGVMGIVRRGGTVYPEDALRCTLPGGEHLPLPLI